MARVLGIEDTAYRDVHMARLLDFDRATMDVVIVKKGARRLYLQTVGHNRNQQGIFASMPRWCGAGWTGDFYCLNSLIATELADQEVLELVAVATHRPPEWAKAHDIVHAIHPDAHCWRFGKDYCIRITGDDGEITLAEALSESEAWQKAADGITTRRPLVTETPAEPVADAVSRYAEFQKIVRDIHPDATCYSWGTRGDDFEVRVTSDDGMMTIGSGDNEFNAWKAAFDSIPRCQPAVKRVDLDPLGCCVHVVCESVPSLSLGVA